MRSLLPHRGPCAYLNLGFEYPRPPRPCLDALPVEDVLDALHTWKFSSRFYAAALAPPPAVSYFFLHISLSRRAALPLQASSVLHPYRQETLMKLLEKARAAG